MLGGDDKGNRILKAAELAHQGYAPVVIAGNGKRHFAHTESQLAIEFAVRHGYPASLFVETNWNVSSTVDEARAAIAELRSRGASTAIIVTTVWHTARAGRVYRRLAPDLTFCLVASDDPNWHSGNWWRSRQGRKLFALEFAKTIADFLRI